MLARGDVVRSLTTGPLTRGRTGMVAGVRQDGLAVVLRWDGTAQVTSTDFLEVLRDDSLPNRYGRWWVRRRPQYTRGDDGMRWRWLWIATAPYTESGLPVTLVSGDLDDLRRQIADIDPTAFGAVGSETP